MITALEQEGSEQAARLEFGASSEYSRRNRLSREVHVSAKGSVWSE